MAEIFASKSRRRNGVMRASHHNDNEEFKANSQQAYSLCCFFPILVPPSLVFINTRIGIRICDAFELKRTLITLEE